MVTLGYLFAGQGAQKVGMGKDFYEQFSSSHAVFEKANEVLQFDLSGLCFAGPEDELKQTVNTQVAIFVTSVAILEAIKETFPDMHPALNCGLSLGEYSALVSAGVLDFETTLRIVRKRGELMESAAQSEQGSMVSIIGLNESQCRDIADECGVDLANLNAPDQFVLSGSKQHISKVESVAKDKGAKRAIVLNVSGGFHSRLMNSAAQGLKDVLSSVSLQSPQSPFISNVNAVFETEPESIKENLIMQVDHSVQWIKTMEFAAEQGVMHFLEIGPGKVLKGLARRINPEITVYNVETYGNVRDMQLILEKIRSNV